MTTCQRTAQRGSAMLITLILVAALLGGAAVLVSMQVSANRATDISKSSMTALHCAEAGLSAAEPLVATNYASWAAALVAGTEPSFLSGIDHDLDNDGTNDFVITLVDNDDEIAPTTNNPSVDNDARVFIVSTCTKYPDTPTQVSELVTLTGGGTRYKAQQGGNAGNGNDN